MISKKNTIDHYRVLQLSRDCTQKEVSASYKRLALLHHPDKSRGDKSVSNHFQQIQEAAEVLRDPKRRHLYDKTLDLQSTSISHGYHKRDEQYVIPQNKNTTETPEQESDTPWNSKPPPEEYMYTWGWSVHMNLDSERAQAEMARHVKEMDEWEKMYARINPDGHKAEYEYPRKLNQSQASPEEEAIVNEDAGEDGGPGPSCWKQAEEANEDELKHGHIDHKVRKSNARLHAYGLKDGVPSDDEDFLPQGASGDKGDLLRGGHGDGDGLWKTKYKEYLYEDENEAGSEYHSATRSASPLIDLSDDEQTYEASPDISKENEAGPADNFESTINKDDYPQDTETAYVIAADERDSESTTGSIGCFIDLSDDEQH